MWDNRRAYGFIILMGFVSLLSDITYESAKSLTGPYLAFLGANALVVSVVSGIGEFLGYALRVVSGYFSDKLKLYWSFTMFGYALNLMSVPALALVKSWQMASLLIFLERIGKAVRTPSRDALLSHATQRIGHGKGFGLHEFLDQIGAIVGPLLVAFTLYLSNSYRIAFAFLIVPALLALILLFAAKRFYRETTTQLEDATEGATIPKGLFWYLLGVSLLGLGFLQFPVIAYHHAEKGLQGYTLAFVYAFAMFISALSAVISGYLFDKKGPMVLPLVIGVTSFYPVFLFSDWILWGISLWGALVGVQESILRSWVAQSVPLSSRASAYGLFYFTLGLSNLLGGFLVGYIYSLGVVYLTAYSLSLGILSCLVFFITVRRHSA